MCVRAKSCALAPDLSKPEFVLDVLLEVTSHSRHRRLLPRRKIRKLAIASSKRCISSLSAPAVPFFSIEKTSSRFFIIETYTPLGKLLTEDHPHHVQKHRPLPLNPQIHLLPSSSSLCSHYPFFLLRDPKPTPPSPNIPRPTNHHPPLATRSRPHNNLGPTPLPTTSAPRRTTRRRPLPYLQPILRKPGSPPRSYKIAEGDSVHGDCLLAKRNQGEMG